MLIVQQPEESAGGKKVPVSKSERSGGDEDDIYDFDNVGGDYEGVSGADFGEDGMLDDKSRDPIQ